MSQFRKYHGSSGLNAEFDRLWNEIVRLQQQITKGAIKQTTKQFKSITTQGIQVGYLVAIVNNVLQRADHRSKSAEWVVVRMENGFISAESCADALVKTMGKNNIEAGDPLYLAISGKCAKEKPITSGSFLQQIGVASDKERNGSVDAKIHINLTHIVG